MFICPFIETLPYNIKGGFYANYMSGVKACLYVKLTNTMGKVMCHIFFADVVGGAELAHLGAAD